VHASSYAFLSSSYALDTSRSEILEAFDADEASIEMNQVLLSLLTPVLNDGLTPITGRV
jgi:ribonucleotide reductase beta subunit family protein with ferritin-like domain